MKILVIDNYDSFTFNLVQMIGTYTKEIIIKRNDGANLEDVKKINPDKILISPGPKTPLESKLTLSVIEELAFEIPILGICLGHQAIAQVYGGKVVKAMVPVHGITSKILHDGKRIFRKIPQRFNAMRYHSLVVDKTSLPDNLMITAESEDGVIMGLRHRVHPVEGIQFHPESILTEFGEKIISNWLKL